MASANHCYTWVIKYGISDVRVKVPTKLDESIACVYCVLRAPVTTAAIAME